MGNFRSLEDLVKSINVEKAQTHELKACLRMFDDFYKKVNAEYQSRHYFVKCRVDIHKFNEFKKSVIDAYGGKTVNFAYSSLPSPRNMIVSIEKTDDIFGILADVVRETGLASHIEKLV